MEKILGSFLRICKKGISHIGMSLSCWRTFLESMKMKSKHCSVLITLQIPILWLDFYYILVLYFTVPHIVGQKVLDTYIRGIERQPTPFVLSLKSVKVLLLCNSGFLQIQCEFMAKFHAQNGQKDLVACAIYVISRLRRCWLPIAIIRHRIVIG